MLTTHKCDPGAQQRYVILKMTAAVPGGGFVQVSVVGVVAPNGTTITILYPPQYAGRIYIWQTYEGETQRGYYIDPISGAKIFFYTQSLTDGEEKEGVQFVVPMDVPTPWYGGIGGWDWIS